MKISYLFTLTIMSLSFMAYAESDVPIIEEETAVAKAVERIPNNYEQRMIGKIWLTTEALDSQGQVVSISDSRVSNYFGIAEYYSDGTFKMQTPEGKPKIQGTWNISEDGKTRTLIAKDEKGNTLFTRTVENISITPDEYIYRIYPDQLDKTVYFDIIHNVKK